jgi:hypothetical protein
MFRHDVREAYLSDDAHQSFVEVDKPQESKMGNTMVHLARAWGRDDNHDRIRLAPRCNGAVETCTNMVHVNPDSINQGSFNFITDVEGISFSVNLFMKLPPKVLSSTLWATRPFLATPC